MKTCHPTGEEDGAWRGLTHQNRFHRGARGVPQLDAHHGAQGQQLGEGARGDAAVHAVTVLEDKYRPCEDQSPRPPGRMVLTLNQGGGF